MAEFQHKRDQILVSFGLTVQKRRRELNLSQEKAAEKAGVHRTYFADVERGTRNISLKKIVAIAIALDLRPSELLSDLGGTAASIRQSKRYHQPE